MAIEIKFDKIQSLNLISDGLNFWWTYRGHDFHDNLISIMSVDNCILFTGLEHVVAITDCPTDLIDVEFIGRPAAHTVRGITRLVTRSLPTSLENVSPRDLQNVYWTFSNGYRGLIASESLMNHDYEWSKTTTDEMKVVLEISSSSDVDRDSWTGALRPDDPSSGRIGVSDLIYCLRRFPVSIVRHRKEVQLHQDAFRGSELLFSRLLREFFTIATEGWAL
jgi:hypothetical protein